MFTGQGMIAAFGSLEITSEIILEFLQREGGRGKEQRERWAGEISRKMRAKVQPGASSLLPHAPEPAFIFQSAKI